MSTITNPNPQRDTNILLAIFFLIIAICIFSCSPSKRMEKAYQRVLTDSVSFKSIGERWSRLQPPCQADTILGKTEVLILSDTQYIRTTATDTLNTKDTVLITNTKTSVVNSYIVDRKAEQALNDTINAMRVKIAALNGQRDTLTQLYNDGLKEAKKPNWWKWSLIGFVLVVIAWKFYPKFKI